MGVGINQGKCELIPQTVRVGGGGKVELTGEETQALEVTPSWILRRVTSGFRPHPSSAGSEEGHGQTSTNQEAWWALYLGQLEVSDPT